MKVGDRIVDRVGGFARIATIIYIEEETIHVKFDDEDHDKRFGHSRYGVNFSRGYIENEWDVVASENSVEDTRDYLDAITAQDT